MHVVSIAPVIFFDEELEPPVYGSFSTGHGHEKENNVKNPK
jgi:hypothetical protein